MRMLTNRAGVDIEESCIIEIPFLRFSLAFHNLKARLENVSSSSTLYKLWIMGNTNPNSTVHEAMRKRFIRMQTICNASILVLHQPRQHSFDER